MSKNPYLEVYEKYKDVPLPEIGKEFSKNNFTFRVTEYNNDGGMVETVHSGRKQQRTLHWIRKNSAGF